MEEYKEAKELSAYLPEEGVEAYLKKRGYRGEWILIHPDTYKELLFGD